MNFIKYFLITLLPFVNHAMNDKNSIKIDDEKECSSLTRDDKAMLFDRIVSTLQNNHSNEILQPYKNIINYKSIFSVKDDAQALKRYFFENWVLKSDRQAENTIQNHHENMISLSMPLIREEKVSDEKLQALQDSVARLGKLNSKKICCECCGFLCLK